jgi:hypothetical protein
MKLEERQDIYKRLEKQHGRNHQLAVAIEEMAELTKEISKLLREDSYTNSKKICEEIADVTIVLEQCQRFFDPDNRVIDFIIDFKLKRLDMFYLIHDVSKSSKALSQKAEKINFTSSCMHEAVVTGKKTCESLGASLKEIKNTLDDAVIDEEKPEIDGVESYLQSKKRQIE